MAEWSKATVSKIVVGATSPRVQIPLSPPFFLPKKMAERSRTCRGVARRAKTEGFTSLCSQAQLHIFTRRQPLFTE